MVAQEPQSRQAYNEQLEQKAADLALVKSRDGRRVIRLVEDRLVERMKALAQTDEQCIALTGLLAAMGSRFAGAQRACKELAARYIAAAEDQ
jgi:hypothetical protein